MLVHQTQEAENFRTCSTIVALCSRILSMMAIAALIRETLDDLDATQRG